MTVEEYWNYCQLPVNYDKRLELRCGEVIELPIPTRKHGVVCCRVGSLLSQWVQGHRVGYIAGGNAGVVLQREPATVVGPDVAYYTDASLFAEIDPGWGDEPPVLAVEVLMPDDDLVSVQKKIEDYLRAGVKLVWVIDYEERTVMVFRPDRSRERVRADQELTGGDVLPGFACRVSDFFRLPGDKPPTPPSA